MWNQTALDALSRFPTALYLHPRCHVPFLCIYFHVNVTRSPAPLSFSCSLHLSDSLQPLLSPTFSVTHSLFFPFLSFLFHHPSTSRSNHSGGGNGGSLDETDRQRLISDFATRAIAAHRQCVANGGGAQQTAQVGVQHHLPLGREPPDHQKPDLPRGRGP